MKRIAIMGLGLMGGALGLTLKAKGFPGTICGYARRPDTLRMALRRGAVDEVFEDPAEAVRDADLVICCVPILIIERLITTFKGSLKEGAVVTDVGSTKAEVLRRGVELLADTSAVFIGSHPIAGSEKDGIAAAYDTLYENATIVVTPPEPVPQEACELVCRFWTHMGGRVKVMPAEEHDGVMARTSHLPHLSSAALALACGEPPRPEELEPFCGPGYRDSTRVAGGSPAVWRDILATNRVEILKQLRALEKQVSQMEKLLEAGNIDGLEQMLGVARQARFDLLQRPALAQVRDW